MRVLVVDDEPIVLESCRRVIGAEGWAMISSSSAAEALAVLERISPDLLLIDVKMPVHDGMYLMRRLRDQHPGIPIVVMSGYATGETVKEAEALGADGTAADLLRAYSTFAAGTLTKTASSLSRGRGRYSGEKRGGKGPAA